jgi:tetratricopeptide (TPR) repeat protein
MTPPTPEITIRPVVSWPRQVQPGGSYEITVDLRLADPDAPWPYDEEELAVGCMIDGRPFCAVRVLGDAGVVLHRFGGTYGPARFVAEFPAGRADFTDAALWLTLTTAGGVPFYTGRLSLDSSAPAPQPAQQAQDEAPTTPATEPDWASWEAEVAESVPAEPEGPAEAAKDGNGAGSTLLDDYLFVLTADQRELLARVNAPGLAALRSYLNPGEPAAFAEPPAGGPVAFLGEGASAPLYPLWDGLIAELIDAAAGQLTEEQAATCRALASSSPESAVEIVRRSLGPRVYRAVLRQVLRVRTDPESGRSWTPVQELVCRCAFKAVVTTTYDPGIVNARMRVRPGASATGFTTWEDELTLDRWRTGDVFGDAELPVLFAHGQHNRPDSVVLATTEYRRAYQGKLPRVLGQLMDTSHLVWIGFSFGDQRITAILREIADQAGTRIDPGAAPRHVAVMAWDPAGEDKDPVALAQRAEIAYGAQVVLYPAPGGDHSALVSLLSGFTDERFDESGREPPAETRPDIPARWVPPAEPVPHFTGRAEELARLDRWAADPQVALVGVTAWGGAGKTALVTHWALDTAGTSRRRGLRGAFGWSFYADPSAEHWAEALLRWARQELGVEVVGTGALAARVLALLRTVPLLLVLDGLEVVQEGPASTAFGRLLDGTLRAVLAGACQQPHGGLVVPTSRFPFSDLEDFDGGTARMLEVPPFTPAEGSALLAAAGGGWLAEHERRALVAAVDGHALATGVLAGLLAARPPESDLAALRAELAASARTDTRVGKVLAFYANRLAEPDRYLLAAVSLFPRPVQPAAVLEVARHEAFGDRLAGWSPAMVQAAVRSRLSGLASWHPDGTISAHPLVRDTFRPLVLDAAGAAAETTLSGIPSGTVTSRADALRAVEAVELLLDAGHWRPADELYKNRSGGGRAWRYLPAARLGQRAATAFVATPARRDACATRLAPSRLVHYLTEAGLHAMNAGDLATARDYLPTAAHNARETGAAASLATALLNLAECLGRLGHGGDARAAAIEALTSAETAGDRELIRASHTYLGWAAGLAGDTAEAEQRFTAGTQIRVADDPGRDPQYASGIWWAEWLARTGRPGPAEALTRRNADISRRGGSIADVARCERVLGRLALAAGDVTTAGGRLTAAAATFRDGDYLTDLADTLPALASCAEARGDLDAAERHAVEAITVSAPRGLVPAHSSALVARAHIRAAQAAAASPDLLFQGRDAADAALRLAVRHHLPWHEIDAMRAHARLDKAENADHGWATRADELQARLLPSGLNPDPLTGPAA